MKISLPLVICLPVMLAACSHSRQSTDAGHVKNTRTTAKNTRPDIIGATLSRGACFGRCPVYTVQLWQDGKVRYTGQMNTQRIGIYEKNVGAENVLRLFQNLKSYRIDTMQATYPVRVSDLPSMTLTVTYNDGKEQQIEHADLGPEMLYHFGQSIDSLAKVDFSWTRISSDPSKP